MRKRLIWIFCLSLPGLFQACSDDSAHECPINMETALIKDLGNPAADGCGWVVDINSEIYRAVNLAEEYKVDNLSVKVVYEQLAGQSSCGMDNRIPKIEILMIEINQ